MYSTILIVDDEAGVRSGLRKLLSFHGYKVLEAEGISTARKLLRSQEVAFVLLDLRLGSENGVEFLRELKSEGPYPAVIVITGYGDVRSAVECMQAGAANYITKPIDHDLLLSILEKETKTILFYRENLAFRETLASTCGREMVSSSHPEMRRVEGIIEKIKDSDATVLILGETGTGKELVAQKIHYSGMYRNRPFISVNCAAINDNLLESEIFGHERGAFTGAIQRKLGRFELAGNGTLFLDEVGDMSLSMQSKLLRVLQERTFERVGGTKTLTAHCRIISSTNRNLERLLAEGRFREDLYYRLSVVTLRLPPLRERKEDIPLLVQQFIEEANRMYHRRIRSIPPSIMNRILLYDWPGNIRQLKNVITNAVLLSEGEELSSLDLPSFGRSRESEDSLFSGTVGEPQKGSLKARLEPYREDLEARIIRECLERNRYNITRAAEELGISRKTLYFKLHRYHVSPDPQ